MLARATPYTEALRPTLTEAQQKFGHLIVATPVPVFVEACFHGRRMKDDEKWYLVLYVIGRGRKLEHMPDGADRHFEDFSSLFTLQRIALELGDLN